MPVIMNKREKISVSVACIFLLVFVLFQFVISPFMEKKKLLERQLKAKTQILADMGELNAEYEKILNNNRNLKKIYSKRNKNFSLFAFLEKLAGSAGVKANIAYMKPSTTVDKKSEIEFSIVEMKFKSIKISQLIVYLYMVETSKNVVFVKRLGITKDGKNKNTISAVLHVETVKS